VQPGQCFPEAMVEWIVLGKPDVQFLSSSQLPISPACEQAGQTSSCLLLQAGVLHPQIKKPRAPRRASDTVARLPGRGGRLGTAPAPPRKLPPLRREPPTSPPRTDGYGPHDGDHTGAGADIQNALARLRPHLGHQRGRVGAVAGGDGRVVTRVAGVDPSLGVTHDPRAGRRRILLGMLAAMLPTRSRAAMRWTARIRILLEHCSRERR
jgi:hypothetical protein